MNIIHEFTLPITDEKNPHFIIKIPKTAKILEVEIIENGNLCISVLLDNTQPAEERVLRLITVGYLFNKESNHHYKHVGKLKIPNSATKHLFEIINK